MTQNFEREIYIKFELLYLDGQGAASRGSDVDNLVEIDIEAPNEFEALKKFFAETQYADDEDGSVSEDFKDEEHPLLAYFESADIGGGWPILIKYNFGQGVQDGPYDAEECLSDDYGYPNVDEISPEQAKYWGIEDEYDNILQSYDDEDDEDFEDDEDDEEADVNDDRLTVDEVKRKLDTDILNKWMEIESELKKRNIYFQTYPFNQRVYYEPLLTLTVRGKNFPKDQCLYAALDAYKDKISYTTIENPIAYSEEHPVPTSKIVDKIIKTFGCKPITESCDNHLSEANNSGKEDYYDIIYHSSHGLICVVVINNDKYTYYLLKKNNNKIYISDWNTDDIEAAKAVADIDSLQVDLAVDWKKCNLKPSPNEQEKANFHKRLVADQKALHLDTDSDHEAKEIKQITKDTIAQKFKLYPTNSVVNIIYDALKDNNLLEKDPQKVLAPDFIMDLFVLGTPEAELVADKLGLDADNY